MKTNKKTKKAINKREVIVKIITIIAIIIVIAVVSNFINKLDTFNIKTEEHEFYKYFSGEKINYTGALKITRKNDITELITKEGAVLLDNVPIYFQEEQDKALLPATMSITFPLDNGATYKVNSLATVFLEYGDVYLKKGSSNKIIKDAFLFDGESVYFFIDRTTLKVNGMDYELAPLSYVNAPYGGFVEIYNPETDEYICIDNPEGDIIAESIRYKINLTIDSMQCAGKEQLLVRKLKDLKNLE